MLFSKFSKRWFGRTGSCLKGCLILIIGLKRVKLEKSPTMPIPELFLFLTSPIRKVVFLKLV